jgi:NAD(P)-dependent dehydrogenase (short-subunit alcohol dehydrogenase family)
MKVIVTGASRGIGLELTRIALRQGHEVLAVARNPEASTALGELAGEFRAQLRVHPADLRDAGAAASISAATQDWLLIDLLFNNAGILLEGDTRADFLESFLVNAVAPFEVVRSVLPRLKLSANPRVVNLTSRMGSISDNSSGGHYSYRASKAALNMINRSLARDHSWLSTIVVHPGWAKTRMGGEGALVEATESASGIWRLAQGLTREQSGRFYDYLGRDLPW